MVMMLRMFSILAVVFLCLSYVSAYNQTTRFGFPICSPNIYLPNGQLSIDQTLYNCSANMPGPLIIRSYIPSPSGELPPVNISLAVKINNLIEVDDITSEVQMGFFLRLQWHDERWYMPELFEQISPQASNEGLDITGYIESQNPLNIWMPDIVFYEGTGMTVLAQFVRLFPDGKVYWSRNLLANVQQSQNLIRDYPNDVQNFSLTFQSYSYETQFLNLNFMSPPVIFRYNAEYSKNVVELNQLWTYHDFTAFVANVASPAVFNPNRQYSSAYVNLKFSRQSFGVVFRLALPVAMFMLIVGFSFWSDIEKRLDISVQMLLIVTALYLIIGTVIPFVGYLTTMDQYMSCVFVLLSLLIGVHVVTLRLDSGKEQHPMGEFYNFVIVLFFKVVWLPCAIAVFMFFFSADQTIIQLAFYASCIACASQVVFAREEFKETFKTSLIKLRAVAADIKEQKNKRLSGRLTGHDHHLIQKLTRLEQFALYMFRNRFRTAEEKKKSMRLDKDTMKGILREDSKAHSEEGGTFADPPSPVRRNGSGRVTSPSTATGGDTPLDRDIELQIAMIERATSVNGGGGGSPYGSFRNGGVAATDSSGRYYHERGYAGVDQQYRSNTSTNGYDVVVGGEHYQ